MPFPNRGEGLAGLRYSIRTPTSGDSGDIEDPEAEGGSNHSGGNAPHPSAEG